LIATAGPEPSKVHRILHIMDKVSVDRSKIHGPARQIAYRVPFYPPEQYKVMLCNLRQEDAACDVLRASGVEVLSLNLGKFDPRAFFDILKLAKHWKPTLIHMHGYGSHNFGRLAGRMLGIPTLIQEHFVDDRLPGYQKVFDFFLRRYPKKALAVSEAVKKHMARDRYIPEHTIEVLGNGVPSEKTLRADPSEVAALRATLGIPDHAAVIGIVGRLAEMKGHKYLLEAATLLVKDFSNLHVLIVGDGPERAGLIQQADAAGLSNRIHFAGYQENVIPYLSALDISVVASIFNEGFNTVGVESFGVGSPLVITNLDCFHDLYFHENNCLMVPPRNSSEMAGAIRSILTDKTLRERLVAGGQDTLERYRMDNISSRYMKIYDSMQFMFAPFAMVGCL